MDLEDKTIAVIGLGYVGLPLALAFGAKRKVVGVDINSRRIEALCRSEDTTLEATKEEFDAARHLSFTSDPEDLNPCGVFIATVPTPIDRANRPDLTPLLRAQKPWERLSAQAQWSSSSPPSIQAAPKKSAARSSHANPVLSLIAVSSLATAPSASTLATRTTGSPPSPR